MRTMIIYLVKRYFFIALIVAVIALAMIFLIAGMDYGLLKALLNLFLSGIIAIYFTHRSFERQNLWVLYHNLRLSKSMLLALCLVLFQFTSMLALTLRSWGFGFDL